MFNLFLTHERKHLTKLSAANLSQRLLAEITYACFMGMLYMRFYWISHNWSRVLKHFQLTDSKINTTVKTFSKAVNNIIIYQTWKKYKQNKLMTSLIRCVATYRIGPNALAQQTLHGFID